MIMAPFEQLSRHATYAWAQGVLMDIGGMPFGVAGFAIGALAVFLAYVLFGIFAFGAPLIAVPVLAQSAPLVFVVPLQGMLDLLAGLTLGKRAWREVERAAFAWLLLPMLIGMVLGVTLLVSLSREASLIALGLFLVVYGTVGLTAPSARWPLPAWAGVPFGLAGGVLSALFSTGGPLYLAYLANRIGDARVLRATTGAVALTSAFLRAVVFAVSGLLADPALWLAVAVFVPCVVAGVHVGTRLQPKLKPRVNRALIYVLLLVSGAAAIARAL